MEKCTNWLQWLNNTRFSSMSDDEKSNFDKSLNYIRDNVLNIAQIQPNEKVIDIGTGTGLLAFGALEKINKDGLVVFSDISKECLQFCKEICEQKFPDKNAEFVYSDCSHIDFQDEYFDKVLMRSVLAHIVEKQPAINEIYRILKKGGVFAAFEPLLGTNIRYHELTNSSQIDDYEDFKNAENQIMTDKNNSLTNFDNFSLQENFEKAGFSDIQITLQDVVSKYVVKEGMVNKWFESVQSPNHKSMRDNFLNFFNEEKVDNYIKQVEKALMGKELSTCVKVAWMRVQK